MFTAVGVLLKASARIVFTDLVGGRTQVERERESGFLVRPVAFSLFFAHDRLPCIVRNSIRFTEIGRV